MVSVLRETRAWLARPGSDFAWSSWENQEEALAEIDGLIAKLESGRMPPLSRMTSLFGPTGSIQEVSCSSGWADEFLDVAKRFDAAIEQLPGDNGH